MTETPPEETPPQEPAQATKGWDDLFKGEDPAKVREALDNSRRWESRAKENFEKAQAFDKVEESKKTEVEKAAERVKQAEERAEAAEKRAVENERKALVNQVAAAKGVPAHRISGATKEELEADADAYIAERDAGKKPPPGAKSLKSGSSALPDTGEKGRAAAALRSLRQG